MANNVAIIVGSGVSVRNLAAIMAAFAIRGEVGQVPAMRAQNFKNSLADGLFGAFHDGLLQVGATDFLTNNAENDALYPFNFTNEEILALVSARFGSPRTEMKEAFTNYANEICQSYADNLRAANINLEELEMAELQFMDEPITVRSEVETAIETTTEEPLTVAQQLVENTANVLDAAADERVSMYEALFNEETVVGSIDAPTIETIIELAIVNSVVNAFDASSTTFDVPDAAELTEAEVLPEPPAETSPIVPIPDFEPELTNDDLTETVVDAPIEVVETVEAIEPELAPEPTLEAIEAVKAEIAVEMSAHTSAVLEAKLAAQEIVATSIDVPIAKKEFVSIPEDLAATVAQVEGMGVFAAMAPVQQPRELKSPSQSLKEAVQARAFGKKQGSKSRQERVVNAVKKDFVRTKVFRTASKTRLTQFLLEATPQLVKSQALHSIFPFLGTHANNGVPSSVGRGSISAGKVGGTASYASIGIHQANVPEGFFYPSCSVEMDVWSGRDKCYKARIVTVPYIIKAPVEMVQLKTRQKPNLVIADVDTIMACKPRTICCMDTREIAQALNSGAILIGCYKYPESTFEFFAFEPAKPNWVSLNAAVQMSTPFVSRRKA